MIRAIEKDDKGERIRELFDGIAPRYDRLNRLLSLSLDRQWRAWAVGSLQLQPGERVLDLACGTGRILLPTLEAGGEIEGFDNSPAMLARLRENAAARGL
ncbi:MAG: dimethylmenaquinone methyltransferase, partial [Armatimonadota bacterium]